jgi:hypothetical protein
VNVTSDHCILPAGGLVKEAVRHGSAYAVDAWKVFAQVKKHAVSDVLPQSVRWWSSLWEMVLAKYGGDIVVLVELGRSEQRAWRHLYFRDARAEMAPSLMVYLQSVAVKITGDNCEQLAELACDALAAAIKLVRKCREVLVPANFFLPLLSSVKLCTSAVFSQTPLSVLMKNHSAVKTSVESVSDLMSSVTLWLYKWPVEDFVELDLLDVLKMTFVAGLRRGSGDSSHDIKLKFRALVKLFSHAATASLFDADAIVVFLGNLPTNVVRDVLSDLAWFCLEAHLDTEKDVIEGLLTRSFQVCGPSEVTNLLRDDCNFLEEACQRFPVRLLEAYAAGLRRSQSRWLQQPVTEYSNVRAKGFLCPLHLCPGTRYPSFPGEKNVPCCLVLVIVLV